jgi:hypothetical protein
MTISTPSTTLLSTSASSQTISLTELTASTTYYYNISACDPAGNCNISSQYSFTTSAEAPLTSGSSGSGYPTFNPNEEELKKGFVKTLSKNWKIRFNFKNESHLLSVEDIDNASMTCTIYSEPKKIIVFSGQEYKIDLDNDNYYDFLIKLNSIENKKANIEILLILNKTPEQKVQVEGEDFESDNQEPSEEIIQKNNDLYLVLLILLITIIIILFVKYKKK